MGWEGFPSYERIVDGQTLVRVEAGYYGPDDDPTPIAVLIQPSHTYRGPDLVELTADDLEWLRDDVIPAVLDRMRRV